MSSTSEIAENQAAPVSAVRANALGMLSMVLWAGSFPILEPLLETWSVGALAVLRLSLCFFFISAIWLVAEGWQSFRDAPWVKGLSIGAVGFGVGIFLVIYAQKVSDPVTVAIVVTSGPIIGSLLEVFLDGRRLNRLLIAGLVLAILGGLVAAGARVGAGNTALGASITLVSATFYMWGSRAVVKDFPKLSNFGRAGVTFGGAALVVTLIFLALYAVGRTDFLVGPVTSIKIGALLFYAIVTMAISQVLWFAAVQHLGIAIASFHLNATPFYVMIIMYAVGGEWLWAQVLGAGLVATGAIVAQWQPHRIRRKRLRHPAG